MKVSSDRVATGATPFTSSSASDKSALILKALGTPLASQVSSSKKQTEISLRSHRDRLRSTSIYSIRNLPVHVPSSTFRGYIHAAENCSIPSLRSLFRVFSWQFELNSKGASCEFKGPRRRRKYGVRGRAAHGANLSGRGGGGNLECLGGRRMVRT